jgi:glycosyltransferase involved in cell wall biosynthesis
MKSPRVSVLIATYNRPHLLPRALDSLVDQTMQDFEVVVVNDGGADLHDIVARYEPQIDVRLITHSTNLGVTAAQNTAIEHAGGEAIALLADDDRYLPHHLETLCSAADDAPVVIPYTDGVQVLEDEAGNVVRRSVLPVPAVFDRDRLLVENYIPAIALLIPRVAFDRIGGPFDTDLAVLEDWELWLRMSSTYEFRRIDAVTFEYFVRGGRANITTREVWRFHQCLGKVYERHPVPDGSALASHRERLLRASQNRADSYLFDHTVAVAADPDPDAILAALRTIVDQFTDRSYEVLVVTRRTPDVEALAAQISGDVSFAFTEVDPTTDLEAVAGIRAAGRRTHFVTGLDQLTAGSLIPSRP